MPNQGVFRKDLETQPGSNADLEGNDKFPGEERGKAEKLSNKDLKGKKVDANPSKDEDKPVDNRDRGNNINNHPIASK